MDNGFPQPMVGQTDQFGNKIINPNWQIAQPKPQIQSQSSAAPIRKPGNFLTHLLPAAGGTLGSIIGSAADLFSGPVGTIAGGTAGSALGKLIENKIEKQSLGSGVAGQAALGGAGAVGGELLGGAFNGIKGLVSGGSDAAGELAANEAAQTAGKITATEAGKQGVGERLLNIINPEDLPGNAVGNVGEATRLNNFATDELGLRGSSTQKLSALAKQFDTTNGQLASKFATSGDTTSLDTINSAIDNAIKEHPLNPVQPDVSNLSNNDIVRLQQSGAFDNPVNQKFNEAAASLKGVAAKMAEDNGGNFSDAELNSLRQQIDKFGKFNTSGANATDIPSQAAKSARSALNDILSAKNPEARALIGKQSDMITLGDALGKSSGNARAGVRIGGVRLPLPIGGALESAQSGLGVALGGGTRAEQLLPALGQAGAQEVGNKVEAGQQQQTTPGDYTELHPAIQQLIAEHSPENTNPTGITDQQIQDAMLKDIQTTGGKNIAHLNTLQSAIDKMQTQNGLPSGAVTQIGAYQDSLKALQSLSDTFNGQGGADQTGQALANASKVLSAATGLSGKDLTGQLPTAFDKPEVVQQKLSSIRDLIDQKAMQDVQKTLDAQKQSNDQASFLANLLPQGAGA